MSTSSPETYCNRLAAQAWKKIAASSLVNGKKIGKCPPVVIKKLDEPLNGLAYDDHIELNSSRLDSPDRELFLYKTTLHEVAHVAEYRIAGVMTHGPLWHALDDLIDGDGLQFSDFRPKENFWEELFITIFTVAVLLLMVIGGAALFMNFPCWWGYSLGVLIGGFGVFGLLAGLSELLKKLS